MDDKHIVYQTIPFSDPEQELKFVDPDIAEACKKMGSYVVGTPTQMQLCRNLRELTEFLKVDKWVKSGSND